MNGKIVSPRRFGGPTPSKLTRPPGSWGRGLPPPPGTVRPPSRDRRQGRQRPPSRFRPFGARAADWRCRGNRRCERPVTRAKPGIDPSGAGVGDRGELGLRAQPDITSSGRIRGSSFGIPVTRPPGRPYRGAPGANYGRLGRADSGRRITGGHAVYGVAGNEAPLEHGKPGSNSGRLALRQGRYDFFTWRSTPSARKSRP